VSAQAPHLPWPAYRWASLSCASSPRLPRPSMRFLFVASYLLHSGFLQTSPHSLVLAFGSWLYSVHDESKSILPQGGLPPHKFAPMLGAHNLTWSLYVRIDFL